MKQFHYYDLKTGMIAPQYFQGDAAGAELNKPPGCGLVEGTLDRLSTMFDLEAKKIIDYVPPAPENSELEVFEWNSNNKRWISVPTTAAHWVRVRNERDRRLADCDWVAIKSLESKVVTPIAWRSYRQALRDITLQADPLSISWPLKPT